MVRRSDSRRNRRDEGFFRNLTEELVDAVRLHGRYETATRKHKTDTGETVYETRRQYNERFGQADKSPDIEVPEAGEYLWDWYFDAEQRFSRIRDGVCYLISPSEWMAWRDITRNLVYPWEFDILAAMDRAYARAVNEEIEAGRAMNEPTPPGKGK